MPTEKCSMKLSGVTETFEYVFPDTLAELVSKYGEAVVTSNALVGMKTAFRNKIYAMTHGEKPVTAAEARTRMSAWVPGAVVERVSKDAVESLVAAMKTMTPEQKKEKLAKLMALLQAEG